MFPHADTCYAALTVERELALKRADRLAPLLDAARRPPSAPAPARAKPAAARRGRLTRALWSLRWVLRPAHA